MKKEESIIIPLRDCCISDVALVGGKNASLGEMIANLSPKGIAVPDGFAVTVNAYWEFIVGNNLREPLTALLAGLDRKTFSNLGETGSKIRTLMEESVLPENVIEEIRNAYDKLCEQYGEDADVAVRSSATAEDLPGASFAGQHESYLNVRGEEAVLNAVHRCFVSLFTDRAIKYREDNRFDHMKVGLSAGVQKMVRSDLASSGVIFTLEPESGFRDIILITGTWGLGENIVQGNVIPDEFYVFKPTFQQMKNAIVQKRIGTKTKTMVYAQHVDHQPGVFTVNVDTPAERRKIAVISDEEINQLANWSLIIEQHYKQPMDIEWAKDGQSGELFIVQARPETVQQKKDAYIIKDYIIHQKGKVLAEGNAIGGKIVSGTARVLHSPSDSDKLKEGEILITEITNPDWDPIMKKAGAIITDRGGRTSHASIVARELGLAAVVGTGNGTSTIRDGQIITVSCATGKTGVVYEGKLEWEEQETDCRNIKMPKVKPLLIAADPGNAFALSFLPSAGVGLMRMEFVITDHIRIHPMALLKLEELKDAEAKKKIREIIGKETDPVKYFVDELARGVATIACAFYPREVIVRMSDFKTNEYANLIGGKEFEPKEENPMIGFRGASRYYHPNYQKGFELECAAMKKVREEMGLTNVKLMIPFCRTVEEGKKVVAVMESCGLKRGQNGLEIYVMAEIPSNILLAEKFAEVFDGFSIGSNDLTQLTLGIDRDNEVISPVFNEKDEAAEQLVSLLIAKAKKAGRKSGLCGQAPSDFPEYARFLVQAGIDSISFNPDALIKGIENIKAAEAQMNVKPKSPNKKQHENT